MKAAFHLSLSLLAAILAALPARAWVPDSGEKVTGRVGPFDRTWHAVEKEEGDAILELLLDPNSFEEPRPKPESGPAGRIAPPTLSLTLAAPERDRARYIEFWRYTDCDTDEPRLKVNLPGSGTLRVLGEPARKLLAMFEAWEAADRKAFLAEPFPRRYVMGSNRHDGGTLSGVALLCYGNGTQWRTIWEANREAVPDPDRPVSGTELVIPAPEKWKPEGIWEGTVTDLPTQPLPQQYVLGMDSRDGGTLSGVARLFYGDGNKWPLIWEANKAAVPDPDYPKPGTVLVIPALRKETLNDGWKEQEHGAGENTGIPPNLGTQFPHFSNHWNQVLPFFPNIGSKFCHHFQTLGPSFAFPAASLPLPFNLSTLQLFNR